MKKYERRIGWIKIAFKDIEQDPTLVPRILKRMMFTPRYCNECEVTDKEFMKYTGTSPHFAPVEEGGTIPFYKTPSCRKKN